MTVSHFEMKCEIPRSHFPMFIVEEHFEEPLAERMERLEDGVSIYWLGQAGFAFVTPEIYFLIDPYLSDFLARKYERSPYSHARMMPPTIAPDEFRRLDFVLCSHRHGDHMDPETLPWLAIHHPNCRIVIPAAECKYAESIGIPKIQLILANAGEPIRLHPDLCVYPVPAAHENLEQDANGSHHYLGYILELPGMVIFHSGDTVPYPGQSERLRNYKIDLALLPVNGRKVSAIAGNFTLEEAINLCREASIPAMLAHHYGMFAFNSLDPNEIDLAVTANPDIHLMRAQPKRLLRGTKREVYSL